MKNIAILVLLCLTQLGFSQESTKTGPQLTFLNRTMDYDTIERYSNGTRTFVFYNTGDEPLVITKVKSSCSCTVPSYTKDTIPPKGRGEIKARYNTKKYGNFDRSLTVTSNAKNGNKVTINIKGVVVDPTKKWGITKKKKKRK